MKITERMRLNKALEMIETISSDCQSTQPQKTWKESHEGICQIYEVVHSIRAPKCRRNHPDWCAQIDEAIAEEKKS